MRLWAALGAAAAAAALLSATPAHAEEPAAPAPPPIDPAVTRTTLVRGEFRGPGWERLYVASASMRREIAVDVLRGSGPGPRPTLYMLDGVEAGDVSGWLTKGGAAQFFSGRPVDVVFTSGGVGSMYTDWDRYDHALGLNRWETFLIDELPPIVESHLGGDGRRAIAGVSMGAQAALMLAGRHPGRYRAVAGISGCYSTADDLGQAVTRITVGSRGGNPENLWGPPSSPEWAAHDSHLNADALRGTVVHLSAATGLPSLPDLVAVATAVDVPEALRMVGGGAALEAGARSCTERFATRLAQLGIPATVHYADAGTHSWPDFAVQLPAAWQTIAPALGVGWERR
ncbi:esterase family protein [Nocardia sp. CDC159]|uniref:Esterase family protein n=1 Tax=Nocardia pulmonis TaxID=2951408 RepID=A0A9X2E1J9_9NOCA|nr:MULTISPECIES: alpha/beta hydrolase family protein [Nocardia]MCM6772144.1 esterase family protein [Nocardia pulmonis]MCM6785198.1 esterase family protein [Nocardia sp. CDC159]